MGHHLVQAAQDARREHTSHPSLQCLTLHNVYLNFPALSVRFPSRFIGLETWSLWSLSSAAATKTLSFDLNGSASIVASLADATLRHHLPPNNLDNNTRRNCSQTQHATAALLLRASKRHPSLATNPGDDAVRSHPLCACPPSSLSRMQLQALHVAHT